MLRHLPRYTRGLDLAGNGVSAAGVESLAAALGVAPRLASLVLSANTRVGPRGAVPPAASPQRQPEP